MRRPDASVLLVDDDPGSLMALEALLQDLNLDLVKANSGEEALRHVLDQEFALILLDAKMPGMDGFQTARLIRQRRRSYHTPIIFLTGNRLDEISIFKGYEAGAVDYMVKPVVPEVLRSKTLVFVDLYRKNAEIKRHREQLRQAARASQRRFYDLVQGLDAIVWEAEAVDHQFSFVSQQAEAIIGYPVHNWTENTNFRTTIIYPEDRARAVQFYQEAVSFHEGREIVYRVVTAGGEIIWVRDHVRVVRNAEGRPEQLRGVMVDVTSHKNAEEHLAKLAHHDSLTGLPNRYLLKIRLDAIISGWSKETNHLAAVLFLDLDGFKSINDTLGHDIGDIVLQTVGRRLQHCIREHDMAARLGGDEFITIIDRITSREEAALVADKIRHQIALPIVTEGHGLQVTCSMGVSFFPGDGVNAESLLKNADMAMYSAKQQGKNNYLFYREEMRHATAKRRSGT